MTMPVRRYPTTKAPATANRPMRMRPMLLNRSATIGVAANIARLPEVGNAGLLKLVGHVAEPAIKLLNVTQVGAGRFFRSQQHKERFARTGLSAMKLDQLACFALVCDLAPLSLMVIIEPARLGIDLQYPRRHPLRQVTFAFGQSLDLVPGSLQLDLQLGNCCRQGGLVGPLEGFRRIRLLSRRPCARERHQKEDAEQQDQHVDERHEEARHRSAGSLNHFAAPSFAVSSRPASARIRSRPSSATHVGVMLTSAMNRPLPVAVIAGP